MSAMKRYLRGIHQKFGHLATWLPDDKLRLGDVGVLAGGRFFRKTTLESLSIPFTTRAGNAGGDWDHSSGDDVRVDLAGDAQAKGAASGHALVSLGSSGAFLFQALGCRTETVDEMASVGNEIVLAYRRGEFDKGWIVIDRLVTARSATVLIADSKSARVELGGKAPLTSLPQIADGSLSVKVERFEGEVTRFVARASLTPMFGASRLHGLFTKKVDPLRGEEGAPARAESMLAAVTVDEQLEGA